MQLLTGELREYQRSIRSESGEALITGGRDLLGSIVMKAVEIHSRDDLADVLISLVVLRRPTRNA